MPTQLKHIAVVGGGALGTDVALTLKQAIPDVKVCQILLICRQRDIRLDWRSAPSLSLRSLNRKLAELCVWILNFIAGVQCFQRHLA
jgi:NADH dehydrogenase FAD-containing subunit